MAMTAMTVMATDYTDSLVVKVNGVATEQSATVSVIKQDGKYEFILKNFELAMGGQSMGIGTIDIKDISATEIDGRTLLQTSGKIQISNGEGDSPSGMWMGPALGDVPIDFTATINGDKVYASIAITMAELKQTIDVTFGSGYQLPNSGFELFHKEGKIDEPNSWHSFASSTGTLSSIVKGMAPHTFVANVTRPGSAGSHSVLVTSSSVVGFVANGTITTGRMNAGSFDATDPANHAQMDISLNEKDSNGDPFYATMVGRPDSLAVWVKFKQGKPNAQAPYATVSAAITDGTYYQEPEDKSYSNILATAMNDTIASNDFKWQRISLPFAYFVNDVQGKAVLITISTNAMPGKGSGTDSLYVDDIEFIYNAGIDNYTIVNDKVYVTPKGKGALVITDYANDSKGSKVANVTVISEDLKKKYTQTFSLDPTDINNVEAATTATETFYTLSGQRASSMNPGQVYIVKKGGKTYKVVKR
jgi:hypothetical protein